MRKPRANTSVALLLEPITWQPRRAQTNCSDRWTTWALMLQGRHARSAMRYHALSFILARNQAIRRAQVERWQHMYLKQLPTIRLSIGPILLRFGDPAICSHLARPAVTTGEPREVSREFIYSRPQRSTQRSFNQPQPFGTGADVPFKASRAELQDTVFRSPLVRVFEREGKPASELTRFESRVVQRSLQLVKRVQTGRTRLEEDVRRNFVSREQRTTPAVTKNAIAENTVFESSRSMRTGTAGPTDMSGRPIDIERLTEQVVRNIDSRIIAHRERTGRIF